MTKEFMDCSRVCNGSGWDNHIRVTMYNMGQYNEEHYSQYLTIKETKELIAKLQKFVDMG